MPRAFAVASSAPVGPGPLRLFSQQLGAQATWLAPLAVLGLVVGGWGVWRRRRRLSSSRKAQATIVWGTWLLTTFAFFSIAARFQAYYLVTFAPPMVSMAAIGVVEGWRVFRRQGWGGWLLPVSLVSTALVEAHILSGGPAWAQFITPALVATALAATVVLLGWRLAARFGPLGVRRPARLLAEAGLTVAVLMLLVGPGAWGVASASTGGRPPGGQPATQATFGFPGAPVAARGGADPRAAGRAPELGAASAAGVAGRTPGAANATGAAGGAGRFAGGGAAQQQSGLLNYLEQQRGDDTYLAATQTSMAAAPLIVASGEPVMSVGGFMGSDPILGAAQFAQLVQTGVVRFYLAGGGGFGGQRGTGSQIASWVQANCATVPAAVYGDGSANAQTRLYDCSPSTGGNPSA